MLYCSTMALRQILNKDMKIVDNRYMLLWTDQKLEIYLTKRGNDKETLITWEIYDRVMLHSEINRLLCYKSHSQQCKHLPTPILDADNVWVNKMVGK